MLGTCTLARAICLSRFPPRKALGVSDDHALVPEQPPLASTQHGLTCDATRQHMRPGSLLGFLILSIAESTYPCSEAKAGTMSSNSDWVLGFQESRCDGARTVLCQNPGRELLIAVADHPDIYPKDITSIKGCSRLDGASVESVVATSSSVLEMSAASSAG
jgi:hypothetical protein